VVEGGQAGEYHGFEKDLESVGALIRLWTSRNGRWLSPKFLAGESYGTVRASALADHLQKRYGLFPNGIMLLSSVIDLGTVDFTEGNDAPTALYLPTYAALAHYHGQHGDRSWASVRAEAEALAARDYPWALARGARLTPEERADIVQRIARLTGLSPAYVDRVNLRLEHQRVFRELLRDRGQVIGRLDGRFIGYEADDGGVGNAAATHGEEEGGKG
jgi:carboxypeptidase C (cathepsin A)